MKTSELIQVLQRAIDNHGDLPVYPDDDTFEIESASFFGIGQWGIIELSISGRPLPGRTLI